MIVYRDDYLVVVDKPSGVPVHRGWASVGRPLLQTIRDAVGQYVYPLHRIDQATSGLVMFALDKEIAATMSRAFAERTVHKHYLALVRGRMEGEGWLDHPVPRGEGDETRVAAQTWIHALLPAPHARCTLVLAIPRTGRLHQIRRHLKHLSHPIVGDVRYGDGRVNREFRERWSLYRLGLHAARLVFPHPDGHTKEVRCLPGPDLMDALAALELRDAAVRALDLAPEPPSCAPLLG